MGPCEIDAFSCLASLHLLLLSALAASASLLWPRACIQNANAHTLTQAEQDLALGGTVLRSIDDFPTLPAVQETATSVIVLHQPRMRRTASPSMSSTSIIQ